MRKLMWFTLGFGLSCLGCVYVLKDTWMLPLAALCGVLAAVCLWHGGKGTRIRFAALLLGGLAVGLSWFALFRGVYLEPAIQLDAQEREASITASGYPYATDYGMAVDGLLELEGRTYQVRVYGTIPASAEPGDVMTGTFRFRVTTPGGKEEATYHSGKGIFLLAYQRGDITVSPGEDASILFFGARLARKIKDIIHACFPEDVLPFAKALLLGDCYDLSYEADTALQVTGMRHVVAVSGLHVSILFALLSTVTLRKRYLSAVIGLPLLLVFAAVAGFTPSVTRACMMAALMLLAQLANKEYDATTALSFASLVMLVCNPMAITAVGFQLSVASVAGIQLFHSGLSSWLREKLGERKGRDWKNKAKRFLANSASVTVSAMVLTAPLCAYYFETVSLISMVTNLLVLWIIAFIFYGIMAVCLLSVIWQSGAVLLAQLVALPIRYVLLVTKVLSKLSLAAVYTQSPAIGAWLIFVYVLLILFWLWKKPSPAVYSCLAVLGLCAALLVSWCAPLTDNCRVTMLDVGQGQCIMLQSQGKTYLVDCGGDSDEKAADLAAQTLLSQGIRRLDGLILTHADRDHAGGAALLLSRIPADAVFIPYTAQEDALLSLREASGGRLIPVDEDLQICFGSTVLSVFGPIYAGADNENSLCVLFDSENCDILITGDRDAFGERMLLRTGAVRNVDILVAGHHGSKYSTSQELLQAVQPEIVLISAGQDNSYGHPSEEVLQRLEDFGCTVYRTDKDGTVTIRR